MASSGQFDEGAMSASMDLESMVKESKLDEETLKNLAEWWNRWFMRAGHKRLGRVLMAKQNGSADPVAELGEETNVSRDAG